MTFSLLKNPTFQQDGVEVMDFNYLLNPLFQDIQLATYAEFTPARNATNDICRALRWGIYLNDQLQWSDNNQYQLSADLNPEEAGRARQMDLIPEALLRTPECERLIREMFKVFHPEGNSHKQAYVVQTSALRYQPTVAKTCYPSPDHPHRDGFNNGIVVLSRTPNLIGGQSRIYDLEGTPLFETQLQPGQGLLVEDTRYQHQVLPMLLDTSVAGAGEPAFRDILIVRIDPAQR